ncbi:MAG TPA: hypothetical protein VHY91_22895 [Pirellulales bacterium]|jgi:hypothetical protein|nr:hypothetical protein [Pirellulales bacterium]
MIRTFIVGLSTLVAIVALSFDTPDANAFCHRHRCRARHACYQSCGGCTTSACGGCTTAPAPEMGTNNAPPPAPSAEPAPAPPAPAK